MSKVGRVVEISIDGIGGGISGYCDIEGILGYNI